MKSVKHVFEKLVRDHFDEDAHRRYHWMVRLGNEQLVDIRLMVLDKMLGSKMVSVGAGLNNYWNVT